MLYANNNIYNNYDLLFSLIRITIRLCSLIITITIPILVTTLF